MPKDPIRLTGATVDLSPRLFQSQTVAASPAAATETIVASVTVTEDLIVTEGVLLAGYMAFTAGTDGASAVVRIRRTDASGTIVKASGAVAVSAAGLYDRAINAFDAFAVGPAGVYVLTLTVASASAASTVSAASLTALVI